MFLAMKSWWIILTGQLNCFIIYSMLDSSDATLSLFAFSIRKGTFLKLEKYEKEKYFLFFKYDKTNTS